MASLYETGWRQGSIINADLPLDAVVFDEASGRPKRREEGHTLWVVATQDCDLDRADSNDAHPSIELRPIFTNDPPDDWGIRSAKHRISETEYVVSTSPRPIVSPRVLTALLAQAATRRSIDEDRRPAFTKWLGLRYDRPAVPPRLLPLAKRIADVVDKRRHRPVGQRVRDILIQFDETSTPIQYVLVAVLDNPTDEAVVRQWLAAIAREIPTDLGVASRIEAAASTGISLHLIESSFAVGATQLTFRPNSPNPEGVF